MRHVVREPFLQFMLIGLFLFGASELWHANTAENRIEVDAKEIARLAAGYARQYGAPPDRAQLDRLVEQYIREEILGREARTRGLDVGDEIIRRRLIQKAEFLLQDMQIAPEPTWKELSEFYAQHAERYKLLENVTFRHIYFSPDQDGEDGAKGRAVHALGKLSGSASQLTRDIGDRFPDAYEYSRLGYDQLIRLFGETPFSHMVLEAPVGAWSGPYRSGFGWHLVFVEGKEASRQPPLEQIKSNLLADYQAAARKRLNDEAFARLERKYTIVRKEAVRD